MPNGPGTYGKVKGRPKMKKFKAEFDPKARRKQRKDKFSKKPARAPRGSKKLFGDDNPFKGK